ncbi:MAG: hypothetical protein EOP49_22090 [Sphingobacteriales bacterium]|nr:MAG: hypothetical protein EOP49_22090 [Sphingobacteriales bacterium]
MKSIFFHIIPVLLSFPFLLFSCGTPDATTTEIDADSTVEEQIAPPDNAATEKDQPGVERPPVPEDSLAAGDGESVIGTSRP